MSWLRRAYSLPNSPLASDTEDDDANETVQENAGAGEEVVVDDIAVAAANVAEVPIQGPAQPERPPTPPQPVRMATNYDMQSGDDTEGALEKACHNLKGYAWSTCDLGFYFQQVELKMRKAGVKNNYTKLLVLSSLLPENVIEQSQLQAMILDIERLQQEKVSHETLEKAMNEYTLQFQRFLQNSLEAHKRETA